MYYCRIHYQIKYRNNLYLSTFSCNFEPKLNLKRIMTCQNCEKPIPLSIDLNKVKVKQNKNHTKEIQITESIGIMMKYPDISQLNTKGSENEMGFEVIKKCINMIFTEEETHERDSFSDKELDDFIDSLNTKQMEKIKNFFDTMPVLKHTVKYTCKTCDEEKETTLQGLQSFFG